jgi:hypothetical protein
MPPLMPLRFPRSRWSPWKFRRNGRRATRDRPGKMDCHRAQPERRHDMDRPRSARPGGHTRDPAHNGHDWEETPRTGSTANVHPSARPRLYLPSPLAADAHRRSRRIGTPRPTRSRVTMTGGRSPGSRVVASVHLPRNVRVPSGLNGRRLAAYSCGGSRGIACGSTRTAFPFDPLREPPAGSVAFASWQVKKASALIRSRG